LPLDPHLGFSVKGLAMYRIYRASARAASGEWLHWPCRASVISTAKRRQRLGRVQGVRLRPESSESSCLESSSSMSRRRTIDDVCRGTGAFSNAMPAVHAICKISFEFRRSTAGPASCPTCYLATQENRWNPQVSGYNRRGTIFYSRPKCLNRLKAVLNLLPFRPNNRER